MQVLATRTRVPGEGSLPRVLRGFWIASAVTFALMFVVGYVRYRAGAPAAHCNPIGTVHFSDLLEYVPTYRLLHTAAFFHNPVTNPVAYPPFGAIFYQLLYATGHAVRAYVACALLWLAVLTVVTGRWLRREGVGPAAAWLLPLTTVGLSFTFMGLVCYGNIELFLWMFAAAGTWALVRGRPTAAAVLWGCAAAMKLYPLIFLVLLLAQKRVRAAAAGVATFAAVTLVSLWYLGPTMGVAWRGSVRNVFGYQGKRVEEWSLHELATNHSAFTWVKLLLRIANHPFADGTMPYYVCGALLFAGVFALRVRRLPLVNQLLVVTTFMLLFPTISYFHTLVHLFAPLVLLLAVAMEAERAGERVPRLWATVALFVPLFGSFMLLTNRSMFVFGGLVQAVLLLVLFYFGARYPFAVGAVAVRVERPAAVRLQVGTAQPGFARAAVVGVAADVPSPL